MAHGVNNFEINESSLRYVTFTRPVHILLRPVWFLSEDYHSPAFILILYARLLLGMTNIHVPQKLPTEVLYVFLICLVHDTRAASSFLTAN